MKKKDERYFNFPIQLLEYFLFDDTKVLNDIADYTIYKDSLKLEHGSDLQKIKSSSGYYKMVLSSDKKTLDNGKILYNSLPINSPNTGMNLSIWWDFYKNDKTEFDKVCLLVFLSIKSILGVKPYCLTNKQFLLNRAVGNVKSILKLEDFEEPLFKYANSRKRLDRIILKLQMNWGLKYFSERGDRGFYISFLEDEVKFYAMVMEQKNKSKEEKFREEKKSKVEQAKKLIEQKKEDVESRKQ